MTTQEAIKQLKKCKSFHNGSYGEAFDMAIKALEQQPNRCDSCIHLEERDGSNCYECVKGMTDNFETQPTDADCISREAIIKHICESKECYKDECKGRLYKRCYDLQWIYALPSVTPQQTRWIPCSERLPQDEQKVLVTTRSGKFIDVTTSIYHHASAYWEHYVIAWMPLPEPYTESGE